jgi:hypothetical protein
MSKTSHPRKFLDRRWFWSWVHDLIPRQKAERELSASVRTFAYVIKRSKAGMAIFSGQLS